MKTVTSSNINSNEAGKIHVSSNNQRNVSKSSTEIDFSVLKVNKPESNSYFEQVTKLKL